MKEVIIFNRKNKKSHDELIAKIDSKGNLIFDGYYSGEAAKKFFGDYDYEFQMKIKKKEINKLLLHLIKDKFKDYDSIRKWIKDKKINFEEWDY